MAAAQGQEGTTDLQRVEISGHRPAEVARVDVHASCPGIDDTLQRALAPAVWREARPGITRVDFRLQGGRVAGVATRGGPRAYGQPIRRAVQRLDCQARDGREQRYSFLLEVRMTDDEERPYQIALLQR
ncbi:MAG: hypothetical protein ABW005_14725 [Burkholderiaceae bacterium]